MGRRCGRRSRRLGRGRDECQVAASRQSSRRRGGLAGGGNPNPNHNSSSNPNPKPKPNSNTNPNPIPNPNQTDRRRARWRQVSFDEIWREQMPFGFVADQARRQAFADGMEATVRPCSRHPCPYPNPYPWPYPQPLP